MIKSEPDVADLFRDRRRKEFRDRTTTGRILPKDGGSLTQTLNQMVDIALKRVHNNFESYERRLTESFRVDESGYHYKNELFTHEISPEYLDYFLRMALWILRAEERAFGLIAEGFDIKDIAWRQCHSDFVGKIEGLEQALGTLNG